MHNHIPAESIRLGPMIHRGVDFVCFPWERGLDVELGGKTDLALRAQLGVGTMVLHWSCSTVSPSS